MNRVFLNGPRQRGGGAAATGSVAGAVTLSHSGGREMTVDPLDIDIVRARLPLHPQVVAAVRDELRSVGPAAFRHRRIMRRFSGRGASRTTLYRWISETVEEDNLEIKAERQTKVKSYMAALEETPEELALRALQVLQATVERQKTQLAEALSKVEALERIAAADGSYAPSNAAKMLGVRPKDLFEYLRGPARWIFRRPGTSEDLAYQDKLQRGFMEHKIIVVQKNNCTDKTFTRARITTKGLAHLAMTFRLGKLA